MLAGFYCSGRSEEPDPVSQAYGDVCLAGHYCPNGTAISQPCPPGTYQDRDGMQQLDDCLACTAGDVPLYRCATLGVEMTFKLTVMASYVGFT